MRAQKGKGFGDSAREKEREKGDARDDEFEKRSKMKKDAPSAHLPLH